MSGSAGGPFGVPTTDAGRGLQDQEEEPANKKPKIADDDASGDDDNNNNDNNNDDDDDHDLSELCWKAWGLFSSYLEDDDDDDDKKEATTLPADDVLLEEICTLLLQAQQQLKPFPDDKLLSTIQTVADMLPILLSVIYSKQAEQSLDKYYHQKDTNGDASTADTTDTNNKLLFQTCQHYLHQSLHYFPLNAVTLSMAANWRRVTNSSTTASSSTATSTTTNTTSTNINSDVDDDCYFGYPQAAAAAKTVRQQALQFLNQPPPEQDEPAPTMEYNPVQEWMEVLLLNQIVGAEYTVDDEDDDDDDDIKANAIDGNPNNTNDNDAQDQANDAQDQDNDAQDDNEGYFSASSVEATARYMTAMLSSRIGHHDDALLQLQAFSGLTHRLHPNVWNDNGNKNQTHEQRDGGDCDSQKSIITNNTAAAANSHQTTTSTTTTMTPVSFQGSTENGGGVLPPKLYQQMCEVFKPGAAFWKECDYANRGYFSFIRNINNKKPNGGDADNNADHSPSNLIDDVVLNYLLPLVQEALKSNNRPAGPKEETEICAYEWWAHSRSNEANLGHMLHFDTDEADLEGKQVVHHPLLSSVLHLTGDANASGATILLDQTPHCQNVTASQCCWRSVPHDNTYMLFPGNLLHGVLPCPGRDPSQESDDDCPAAAHRLTFMIGWKTRQVPDQRKTNDRLYGPCAPLPSRDQAVWVQEIHHGYDDDQSKSNSATDRNKQQAPPTTTAGTIRMEALPSVTPAWEEISPPKDDTDGPPLQLPSSLDRRFFVSGAPQCFLESLFEDDDT